MTMTSAVREGQNCTRNTLQVDVQPFHAIQGRLLNVIVADIHSYLLLMQGSRAHIKGLRVANTGLTSVHI